MTDHFHIQIDRAEGSLPRLIGLIERRGFEIDKLALAENGPQREVRISVRARDGSRCVGVLGRQIDRLVGVRRLGAAASAPNEGAVVCPV